jgi:hypothetical protein
MPFKHGAHFSLSQYWGNARTDKRPAKMTISTKWLTKRCNCRPTQNDNRKNGPGQRSKGLVVRNSHAAASNRTV